METLRPRASLVWSDVDDSLATGPTLPPDDYDEPEGGTKVATGPTLPPDDYDEPEGGTKVATGPTLPPDEYDEPKRNEGRFRSHTSSRRI